MFNQEIFEENESDFSADNSPAMPPLPKTRRIAVMGGSFDPPHLGHIQLAEKVIELGLCDEVMFMPCGNHPFKDGGEMTSAQDREGMLQLAIEGNPAFSYSDYELQNSNGKSYTYDTMQVLTKIFPDSKLFFLMGMDCLLELHLWYRSSEFAQQNNFIVYPRPGVKPPEQYFLVEHFGVVNADKLRKAIVAGEDLPSWDISSTQLRKACKAGEDISDRVPQAVQKYIVQHRLYQ